MKRNYFKKILISASMLALFGHAAVLQAHSGGATLGADGTNPHATALADVTCFDDSGTGDFEPHHLIAEIKDKSEPVPGLLLSLQIYKGQHATSTTDTISGDADYSDPVVLAAGPGVYRLIADKTDAGARAFEVTWHCETIDNIHTGTSITVRQFQ